MLPYNIIVGIVMGIFLMLLPFDLFIIIRAYNKLNPELPFQIRKKHLRKWGLLVFANIPFFLLFCSIFLVFQVPKSNVSIYAVLIPFWTTILITPYIGEREERARSRLLNDDDTVHPRAKKLWILAQRDGALHKVEYFHETEDAEPLLLVDGVILPLEPWEREPYDVRIPLQAGDKECHLVRKGKRVYLDVEGEIMDKKTKYVPKEMRKPWWVWIFVVLCGCIPVLFLGGAVPVCLAIIGIISCIKISTQPERKTAVKVLLCAGVVLLIWMAALGVIYLVAGLSA